MKNRIYMRKYAVTVAMCVAIVLFLTESLFAQGAVVAFARPKGHRSGQTIANFPSNEQLDKLTHIIASDMSKF